MSWTIKSILEAAVEEQSRLVNERTKINNALMRGHAIILKAQNLLEAPKLKKL